MADGQSSYDINIRTTADLRAAEDYKRALQAAIKTAKEGGKDVGELTKRLEGADKALQSNAARALKLEENLKRVSAAEKELAKSTAAQSGGGLYGAMGGGLSGLLKGSIGQLAAFTGVTLGAATAFRQVSAAIQDYAETEDALTSMQLALAAQGKFSREAAQGLAELAGQFERQTNIGDSAWLNQFTKLIQYGGRTEDINTLGETLKNLAGIMGGDLESSANLMIRALNGNFRGFEQLGFVIDKSKTDLENWNAIVKQAERGAGLLEKQTETLSGSWNRLQVAAGNLTKNLGGTTVGALAMRAGLETLTVAFDYWAEKVGDTFKPMEGLKNASTVLTRSLEDGTDSANRQTDSLKAMGDAAERTARRVDQVKQAIQQMAQLDDDEAQARMNLELAVVDDDEKRTGNTLGAARRRASIKARYAAERNQRADEADFAQLSIENQRAGQLLSRRNYLTGAVAYYERKGDKQALANARAELNAFNQTEAPQLEALSLSGVRTFSSMQSRNRVFGLEAATAAVQANTGEREIRNQYAEQALSNLGHGQAAGAFRELAEATRFVPEAVSSARGATALLRRIADDYKATQAEQEAIWNEIRAINSRNKNSRNR